MICGACWQESTSEVQCSACGKPPPLDGRYRLDKQLGQGAGGITFAGTRVADGMPVCIKGLAYRGMSSFDAERLFHREASALRSISHPQIPAYIDDFPLGSGPSFTLYLVQELVVGEDLEALRQHRRPTTPDIVAILGELLDIVGYLHTLNPPIVHRDIKPRNIMRRAADGRLVLVDFGSVKEVTRASFEPGLSLQGTLGFMAPEQLRGEASPQSDLYAIGMVGIALWTGREPATLMDDQHQVVWEGHLQIEARLRAWLRQMTALEPASRFASADQAKHALAEATRPVPPPRLEIPLAMPATVAPIVEAAPAEEAPPASGRWLMITAGSLVALVLVLLMVGTTKKGSSGYAEQAAPVSACAGPCRPLSTPFKENLRFGMTLDEARAARPDVATAKAPETALGNGRLELWVPSLASQLRASRVCMDSEVIGKPGKCCLDFLQTAGLGRVICGTDDGFPKQGLLALLDQVARVYGRPDDPPRLPGAYDFEALRNARWENAGHQLEASYSFGLRAGAKFAPEDMMADMANPSERLVLTHTSAAWDAEVTRLANEAQRADAAARAEAERERQRAIEKARLEREKLHLPKDPL